MKNLLLFEDFEKGYGEKITPEQFKNIVIGSEVKYLGSKYKVEKNDGFVLVLKSESGKLINVNLAMFIHGGFYKK